ncbi:MAG: hypothetical protein HY983_03230, partial [Candidatus Magasanikbacteria bacterium]|nr:hypothetical protein [Candidatus Magasanikbacteria bacterium]
MRNLSYKKFVKVRNLMGGAFSLALFVFGLLPGVAQAATELQYDGGYSYGLVSQTLTKARSPYIFHGGCFAATKIPSGITVTVEAGVIIKFGLESGCGSSAGGIGVFGNFFVNGTPEEPVIFTSIRDDSVGGDTGGDGSATSPQPGNWNDIEISSTGSNIVGIHNAIFRYGGFKGTLIDILSGTSGITLENIELAYNAGFGLATRRSIIITSSSFHDNLSGAINADNLWAPQVDARNSWWGDATGPQVSSNVLGRGQIFWGNVLYDPWIGKPPLNSAPTLEFVPVGGFEDGVEPNTSFAPGQKPVFQVEYRDVENQAPVNIKMVANGASYPLTALLGQDGNYTNGEIFVFSGPTSTFPKGNYSFHFEASDGALSSRLPVSGELTFAIKLEPVILIPGILGTEMKRGSELLWMDGPRMLGSSADEFMDSLMMDQNGVTVGNIDTLDIIRQKSFLFIDFNYSDLLIRELESKSYQENADLFVFPYDWRFSNTITSQRLKEKIDAVTAQTGSQKVDLVAHSMGGLVAKQYVLDNGGSKVNKLIFVGTPHLGAPKAFKNLLAGDTFGLPFILNPLEMKKLSQNMPSAYELLPSQTFFNRFGGYFIGSATTPVDYLQTKNFLLSRNVNAAMLQAGEAFHSSALDNFNASGVSIVNISGCNTPTIGRLTRRNTFLEGGVMTEEYDVEVVAGDGTVTLPSASAVPNARQFFATEVDHAKMMSQNGPRSLITQILTDTFDTSALPSNIQVDPGGNCHLKNGKLISVHSPVDLHVYDAAGNHVGPAANGSVDQNIEGATYDNIANNKFIFVPEDAGQIYTMKLDATAAGTFSLRVANIEDGQNTQTTYFSDIQIVPASQGEMLVGATSTDTVLQFDAAGTNTFVPVSASAVLGTSAAGDVTPPTTSLQLQGTNGQSGWYLSSVSVTLQATDDNAGVLKTEYSLDNGTTWQAYSAPFTIVQEGKNTILYKSIDRAGNREEAKQESFSVDSSLPTTTIALKGQSGYYGWYLSPVTVTISAADVTSGVLRTEYSLDNGNTWQTYAAPFLVAKESTSTVFYRSIDRAGNTEVAKQRGIQIDTTVPEAQIVFDPAKKDIVVSSPPPAIIIDKKEMVRVEDPAGNMLELYFTEKDRRR